MILKDLELKISKILRTGVVIAGLIIAGGWLWSALTTTTDLFHYKEYHEADLFQSLNHALQVKDFGSLVVYAGLVVLVMLPAIRVLFTGVLFIVMKEKILGWTAIAVFTVLVTSFLLGAHI